MAFESGPSRTKRLLIAAGWLLVVIFFGTQWYGYDAAHGFSDPFFYYLGWACYLWGVITPFVLWLALKYPIDSESWRRAIPLHVAASLLLTAGPLSVEAGFAWLRAGDQWTLAAAVLHYLKQHLQIAMLSYWILAGAVQFYRVYDQARARELRAAQLEARLADAQIESLRTQLQPHFLFNTLQAATTLLHEDPNGAEDILLRLSELLRISLEEMRTQEIPLAREIEFLEHYVLIQQRRFGDRLRFEFQIDAGLFDCAVPAMVLQPLVENAIQHGISRHKEDDVVTIRAIRNRTSLELEVANLTSSLGDAAERLASRGMGLSNTRERLRQLYGGLQTFHLFDLKPRGVCVRLSIPIRQLPSFEGSHANVVGL